MGRQNATCGKEFDGKLLGTRQFWQNAENGGVPGVAGGVDTNFFNGTLTQLKVHTLKGGPTAAVPGSPPVDPGDHHAIPSGATPNDGSQGATMGSETPQAPNGAPLRPCR